MAPGRSNGKQRVAGDHIELVANKSYFLEGPLLARVIYKYIPDLNVMYTQFASGDIDVVGLQWITADHYDEAKKLPNKVVDVFQSAIIENFAFNLGKPQFQDPAVREALYYAIDKQTIIDALYYGLPKATETYMPMQSFYFNPALPKHEYNPDKARQLLDDAGWKPGAGGIREKMVCVCHSIIPLPQATICVNRCSSLCSRVFRRLVWR